MRDSRRPSEDELARRLRDSLQLLSESHAGDPPDVATLTRLVDRVRGDERRREARELAQFLACAAVVIGAGMLLLARTPVYYAALQAVFAVPVAIGAIIWSSRRKRAMD